MIKTSSPATPLTQKQLQGMYSRWCRDFLDMCRAARRPLGDDEQKMFIRCTMAEQSGKVLGSEAHRDFMNHLPYAVLNGRAQRLGLQLSMQAKVYLGFTAPNPAIPVMWAHALAYHMRHEKKLTTPFDMVQFSELCMIGVPTNEQYRTIWDMQKAWVLLADMEPKDKPFQDNFLDHVFNSPNLADYLA